MKSTGIAIALGLALGAAPCIASSDASFDLRVSEARRHMRASCGAMKKIPKATPDAVEALAAEGSREIAVAVDLWSVIVGDFAAAPPPGYAGDPGWAQRLTDVGLNLARMQSEVDGRQWRHAFLSCAHACNLVAMMHEANGVSLASDAMTVLRKKVGYANGLLASAMPERALPVVKAVLSARDGVLLAPPPEGPTRDAYLDALPELSKAADAVAEAVRTGADLKAPMKDLAEIVERVYELAI